MTVRKYSSRSQQTTLSSPITSTATTMTVVNGASIMGGKTLTGTQTYTVVIDPDTALEEIVDVTLYSTGNTLTITRGVDGPTPGTGLAHSAGAVVRHMAIGRDYQEANDHAVASTNVHGITDTASLVTLTGTQTLTNKTLTSPVVTSLTLNDGSIVFEGATADSYETTLTVAEPTADRTVTIPNATTTLVGTDTTQTLTNKTLTSPTITGTGAIAGTFTGNLTGNVTGNVSGSSGSTTGNAATATALATARTFQLTGDVEASGVTFDGTGNVSLTTVIGTGAIVNADVNTSAQIAYGKLALTNGIVNADINASAAIDKTKISGTAITAGDSGTVTSTMIADGTIVNADINASAAIDWTKIAPSSTVSATELGYLDGVTSAIQTQLDSKIATGTAQNTFAPFISPAFTGTPTAPTAAANTNTDQIATTAYVQTEIADLIASAPGALDTLDELAAALGDDANFATTVTNNLATKLPLAGGTMSGAIAMGTNKITGLGTPTSSTDAATKAYADTMLPLAGGTMSGAIAMGTNKITGVGDPTNPQDVVTKYYLDNVVLAPSNLTGPITSVGSATSIASQTGTGTKFVVDQSPTIVTPTLSGDTTAGTINGTTIPASKTLVATDSTTYVVPSQTGNSGKYLTTDGTTSSWATIDAVSTSGGSTITVPSGTTVPLTIQNEGTGNSFVVNDAPSDASSFTIDSAGLVWIGSTTDLPNVPELNMTISTETAAGHSLLVRKSNDGANASNMSLVKSRGTNASPTTVQNNDDIGSYNFHAFDGTNYLQVASVGATVDGTPGTNDMPTRLVFRTTADGAGSGTERMRIDSAGRVQIPAGGVLESPLVQNQQTASYTLVLADAGKLVEISNASINNLTVPLNSSVAFPIGTQINILQTGAGQTTVVATGGVTINGTPGLKLRAQWSGATLVKRATDTWVLVGDLSA